MQAVLRPEHEGPQPPPSPCCPCWPWAPPPKVAARRTKRGRWRVPSAVGPGVGGGAARAWLSWGGSCMGSPHCQAGGWMICMVSMVPLMIEDGRVPATSRHVTPRHAGRQAGASRTRMVRRAPPAASNGRREMGSRSWLASSMMTMGMLPSPPPSASAAVRADCEPEVRRSTTQPGTSRRPSSNDKRLR